MKGRFHAVTWPYRVFALLFRQLPRKCNQLLQQPTDQVLGRFIGQISLRIEMFVRLGNHHFWLVNGVHIEEYENLAEVILSASCTQRAYRRSHDRNRFFGPGTVAVGT